MIKEWKINDSYADALNAADITLAFNNMSPDTAFIPLNAAYDSTLNAAFNYGETVLVKLNDVICFRGISDGPRRSGSAPSEGLTVTVKGPWATMEKQIYRQDVSDLYTGGSFTSSETKLSGSITSVVSTLLSFAVSDGAGFVVGTIDLPDITIPEISISGNTVAGALITVLKWCPGAQVIFNYNGAGNQTICNVMKIDSGGLSNIQITDTQTVNYVVRRDLVPTGVRLVYQRQVSINTYSATLGNPEALSSQTGRAFVSEDIAGATIGPGIVLSTLSLNGGLIKDIHTHHFSVNLTTISNWLEYSATRGYRFIGELAFFGGAGVQKVLPYYYYAPSSQYPVCTNFAATYEQVGANPGSGSLPNTLWLLSDFTHWKYVPVKSLWNIPGFVIYRITFDTTWKPSLSGGSSMNFEFIVYGASVNGGNPYGNTISVSADRTVDTLEVAPSGLAAQLFSIRSALFCEGSYSKVVSSLDPMRRRILLESIQSPIQQLTLNASSMIAYYGFGPPEQLGPQDLLDLVRSASK